MGLGRGGRVSAICRYVLGSCSKLTIFCGSNKMLGTFLGIVRIGVSILLN